VSARSLRAATRGAALPAPWLPWLRIAAGLGLALSVALGLAALAADASQLQRVLAAGQDWAIDGHRNMAAASAFLQGGDPYSVEGFLYAPLAVLAMAPLAALGAIPGLAIAVGLKVILIVLCVADATRGRPLWQRIVAAVVVLTWLPVLADLWMGNTEVLLGCAMYLVVAHRHPAAGLGLALVLASVAKPILLPFLLWGLLYRRPAVLVAVGGALLLTLAGLVLLGAATYAAYLEALLSAGRYAVPFSGNIGLSGIAPALLLPLSALVVAGFALNLWRGRDESATLIWSLLVGLIVAPYVALYGAAHVPAGIPAYAKAHPVRVLLLGIAAPLACVNLMATTLAVLLVVTPWRELLRGWPTRLLRAAPQP
jgi:Glycosyltransferase family 87